MIGQLIDLILHLDVHLAVLAQDMGLWLYALLFLIIFAETGLVVTPFLPGDSLLFAVGALCSIEQTGLNFGLMVAVLILAGISGDLTNYWIGRYLGPKVFSSETSRLLNRKHLLRTQEFYEKHGPFTIVIARYMPIIRTFAPFVAGVGQMKFPRFISYSVAGGTTWVIVFLSAGYYFGNVPAIKQNFHIVIFAIIFLSMVPMIIEIIKARRRKAI